MKHLDYDDPAIDGQWCEACRSRVAEYLRQRGIEHGRIGEWPAWHLAPYVSIWAIESAKYPEWIGWWVICGDLPTDYVSAETIKHPREAMRAFAELWIETSSLMSRGERHPTFWVGSAENQLELAPLLDGRGRTLLEWSNDDSYWGPEFLIPSSAHRVGGAA